MSDLNIKKDEILSRLTAHDIYGPELKKSTKGYKMLCPFHKEDTPSFHVYADSLAFHCFGGCNEPSGSAFNFIMKKEGVDFFKALNILAEKAGVDIATGKDAFTRLYDVNKAAQEFYSGLLAKNKTMTAYFTEQRHITRESIECFKLGCTADGEPVVPFLRSKGFTDAEILEAGIGVKKPSGLKDLFWKRVMFPVGENGKIKGFGGRTTDEGEPKYLNSPLTTIFKKNQILYGLDSYNIKQNGFAIVVEGYFDVIMCHQHGFKNAVAPMGTVLTDGHVDTLEKHCEDVLLVFDGDSAGEVASERSAKLLFVRRLRGGVIVMPKGEDPDSFLVKGGDFQKLINEALPFSVYLSKHFPNIRKMVFSELLKRGRDEMVEFLAYMGTSTEAEMFRELSAQYFLENTIKKEFQPVASKGKFDVARYKDYLVLSSRGRFLLWNKIKGDAKKQADEMIKGIEGVRRKNG